MNALIFFVSFCVGGAIFWLAYGFGKRDGIRLGRIDEQIYIAKQQHKNAMQRK